ncbi:MAG TPA: hypothetical protein VEC36_05295 [Patescibacteria group bacterium]|nr:hypothetical protein [Patescibacteria group bacterium]
MVISQFHFKFGKTHNLKTSPKDHTPLHRKTPTRLFFGENWATTNVKDYACGHHMAIGHAED